MSEDFPKIFEEELSVISEVDISDWVKNAIDRAQALIMSPYEDDLSSLLIQKALDSAESGYCSSNIALAAAFDLFVTAQYYTNLTHKGWHYCPIGEPALFFPFTNVCPRCVLRGSFQFETANKPQSGSIGQATSRLLSVFLTQLFTRARKDFRIYRGPEPVDMLIYDVHKDVVLLAEIKAAPLATLPLVIPSDEMIESVDGGDPIAVSSHSLSDNPFLNSSELFLFLPLRKEGSNRYRFVSLGNAHMKETGWAYKQLRHILERDSDFFREYLDFWLEAFEAYQANYRVSRRSEEHFTMSNTFWFTNACGQPYPRPSDWPLRQRGSGYESVSDGKTSVGMDRTDDIKKGIYQVLKVGVESKPGRGHFQVKTALISNIHAVRHYRDYLHSLEDVVWLIDKSKKAKKVVDLSDDIDVYNLFDGIISFTESHIRDEWIEENFLF